MLRTKYTGVFQLPALHLGIIGPDSGFTTFLFAHAGPEGGQKGPKIFLHSRVQLIAVQGFLIKEKTDKIYPASASLAHLKLALPFCSRRLLLKPSQFIASAFLRPQRLSQIRKMGDITHATIKGMFCCLSPITPHSTPRSVMIVGVIPRHPKQALSAPQAAPFRLSV